MYENSSRKYLAILLALGSFLSLLALISDSPSYPTPTPRPSPNPSPNPSTSEVVAVINRVRSEHGLSILHEDNRLNQFAQKQAEKMERDGLHHSSGEAERRYYNPWSEIVANGPPDKEGVVDLWMHSEGHKRAILDPEMIYIGCGKSSPSYWCVQFGVK